MSRKNPCFLRRSALAVAIAAAGLSAPAAWAATDYCTSASTVVSTSVAPGDDKTCVLNNGQSLTIESGKTFAASNSGTIDAFTVPTGQTANFIDNYGTLHASYAAGILDGTLGGGIVNRAGALIDGAEGIVIQSSGSVQNGIVNDGTISTYGSDYCHAIWLTAPTSQLTGGITNRGTITPCTGAGFYGISNQGSIDAVNNAQGGAKPLTYQGNLPGIYRIIVNSPASYGVLQLAGSTGTMGFGINPGSTLQVGTYPGVLIAISEASLASKAGVYGPYLWQLVQTGAAAPTWDLVVTLAPVAPTQVPTLSEWGGVLLAGLLGILGMLGLRRRPSA